MVSFCEVRGVDDYYSSAIQNPFVKLIYHGADFNFLENRKGVFDYVWHCDVVHVYNKDVSHVVIFYSSHFHNHEQQLEHVIWVMIRWIPVQTFYNCHSVIIFCQLLQWYETTETPKHLRFEVVTVVCSLWNIAAMCANVQTALLMRGIICVRKLVVGDYNSECLY